jgi:DMSO/TMAO reductase YedYZ molybdopterin-dependent catalytic subunit
MSNRPAKGLALLDNPYVAVPAGADDLGRNSSGDTDSGSRRAFIRGSLAAASLAILGCGDESQALLPDATGADTGTNSDASAPDGGMPLSDSAIDGGELACADPFAGGTMVEVIPFLNEGSRPLEKLLGSGLDGRLYTDLAKLGPDDLITPNESFYIRTRYPDQLDASKPWAIDFKGLVKAEKSIAFADLEPLIQPAGTFLLECAGNGKGGSFGLLSAAKWDGIPMTKVLELVDLDPSATRVHISGFDSHSQPSANNHSTPGAAWVFSFEQLERAFLATHMNGVPLPKDHGFPVRLFNPRWYGCSCIKWVDQIRLTDDTEPATSQMMEFASRTHQNGEPPLAVSYAPAEMGQSATPVQIEKWEVDGETSYRVVGIMWGGERTTDKLMIRFNDDEAFQPVDLCPPQETNDTWTLWVHEWKPKTHGIFGIQLAIDDPSVPTLRLDSGYYRRSVEI